MNPVPFRAVSLCGAALSLLVSACASSGTPAPPIAERGPVMCTQDVQQCPDGRFVGRTPPGCAFVCPQTATPAPGVR